MRRFLSWVDETSIASSIVGMLRTRATNRAAGLSHTEGATAHSERSKQAAGPKSSYRLRYVQRISSKRGRQAGAEGLIEDNFQLT